MTETTCNREEITKQLEDLHDRGYIYAGTGGTIVVETIAQKQFPGLDIDYFAECLGDNLFELRGAIEDYLYVKERNAEYLKRKVVERVHRTP